MDIFLLLGILLFAGFGGGSLFRKLRIPQVVAYVLVGTIVGVSGFRILNEKTMDSLSPLNTAALGFIGFMIGSELRLSTLRKLGKYITSILLCEALGAYFLVALVSYALTREIYLALLLGALASATAPAATVDVLWEYKAKGILTTTLLAIVGLDDAVGLILYGFSVAIAKASLIHTKLSIDIVLKQPAIEIGLAIAIGVGLAVALSLLLRVFRADNQVLILTIAAIFVAAGVARTHHFSPILTCMFVGLTLSNISPRAAGHAYRILENFTPPVYVLFFILVGSRLDVRLLPSMGALGLLYVAARSTGKIAGASLGATISRAPLVLRKYLGLTLFSQAGVAIGIAISIYEEFSRMGAQGQQLGVEIISLITATTFIVQIIGPPFVKYAITKAGEVGKGA